MSYLIAPCRTPIGKLLGGLSSLTAPQLGAIVVRETLRRAGLAPDQVDEVMMGNVLQAGVGQAPARQVALGAGLPPTVSALTVNMVCGSGLRSVMLADAAVRAGEAKCIIAGGMESMSRAPHLLPGVRSGWKYGNQQAIDAMIHDGLWCAFENASMGNAADYIAAKYKVSRADQDAWSAESHRRAVAARDGGRFRDEIVTVPVAAGKTTATIDADEGPRADTSAEKLATLKPAFSATGCVTAGNASQISDGAAAVAVVDEPICKAIAPPWSFRVVSSAAGGVAPKEIFIAPVEAVRRCLAKAKLTVGDVDLFEINEAFASQTLACARELKIDEAKLNVHGGAIALGHPIGASGTRVLVTLLHALVDRGLRRGLATLCLGGGNAVAMLVERHG
jgi:acetyl-CoA C-acetyltransferase